MTDDLLDGDLNPLVLKQDLRETLARFIATSAGVSATRAPKLNQRLKEILGSDEVKLVRGPFVESLPDFEKGETLQELINSGRLCEQWRALSHSTNGGKLLDRPLHKHQQEALDYQGNYLVATGTGSGKTESFLYPLINDLLQAMQTGAAPGVKAILVYPLNALANDQLNRIAELIFKDLGDPGITIGRFTGQIKASTPRSKIEGELRITPSYYNVFGDRPVTKNWRLSRQDMLDNPPDILITNYAMLEHVLLLPRNKKLLNNAKLSWLVLDEIHTYAGAQAIEVAFLLRKLKAVLGVERGFVKCVGTSASLDPDRAAELATFAENLFGERFSGAASVITAERRLHQAFTRTIERNSMEPANWVSLSKEVLPILQNNRIGSNDKIRSWNISVKKIHPDFLLPEDEGFGDSLIYALANNTEVYRTAQRLHLGAVLFAPLAREIFGDTPDSVKALAALIQICIHAKSTVSGDFPLLPARYHLAAAGIEGVRVTLGNNDENWTSSSQGKPSEGSDGQSHQYRLLVCRNCGEPYVEGFDNGQNFLPLRQSKHDNRCVLRLISDGSSAGEFGENSQQDLIPLDFDPKDGDMSKNVLSLEIVSDEEKLVRKCVSCGYKPARFLEPVTDVTASNEALTAVTAQVLMESLPASKSVDDDANMGGRNLLVFSDSRQDAAFFAPFFERTSREQAIRASIYRVLERGKADDALDLEDLTDDVTRDLRQDGFNLYKTLTGKPLKKRMVKEKICSMIVVEFTSGAPFRLSLESLGMVRVHYNESDVTRAAEAMAQASLIGQKQAREAVIFLLDLIRWNRAITNLDDVLDLTDPDIWGEHHAQRDRAWSLVKVGRSNLLKRVIPDVKFSSRLSLAVEGAFSIDRNQLHDGLKAVWGKID